MATYNLSDLGDILKSAADSINKKIHDEMLTLDFHQIQELSNRAQDLLFKAKALYQQQTIDIANNNKEALAELGNASNEINNAIKTIKTVQTVIDITAQLVSLASAVLSGNFNGIVTDVGVIISKL